MFANSRLADGTAHQPTNLVDVLRWRATDQAEHRAYTFLVDGEAIEAHLTYRDLDLRARAIGARLQELGAAGEPVMLVCPPGLDYVAGFFGCLYAGAVAVPAYPPRANRTTDALLSIVGDSGARVALTTTPMRAEIEREFARAANLAGMSVVPMEGLTDESSVAWRHPGATPDTLAFLQYTSGSTGTPKGVMVSHGNLIANMRAGWDAVTMTRESVPFSWLPPFHDMGLISGVIQPVFAGLTSILMSPSAFIQRPVRWLRAISRYGVTHTGGPPFAYDYCLRRITPDQLVGIDLSTWVTAYVGAEPIRVETLERFATMFGPYGLRPSTLFPCYGMAEATLMVSGGPRLPRLVSFAADTASLEENRVLAAADRARVLAASGQSLSDTTIVIANPDSLVRASPDEIGEIWVNSPAVARGYWNRPAESNETFRACLADTGEGPFLRTGDLGFLDGGQVFVTGRLKDLIILKGKNHYPQDIERTVEQCHTALRPSGVAAFSTDHDDGEQLVVVQEVDAAYVGSLDADAVIGAIRQAVAEEHDVTAAAIVLLRPGSIPKTSSGKIRRRATRDAYLAGGLSVVATWIRPGVVLTDRLPQPAASADAVPDFPPALAAGEKIPHDTPVSTGGDGAFDSSPSRDEIAQWLVARLAEILRVDAASIDVREPFARYGLTSVDAVGLSGDLEAWLGRRLSPTLAYDYPSIEVLARRLDPQPGNLEGSNARPIDPEEPIAIIGLGCRLPGAGDPDALWQLLRDGVDAVGEAPADRWSIDDFFDADPNAPGKMYTRRGGFLERVDGFDADFFRIAAREATRMDPQQRLLLEVSWEALEDAGQAVDRLEGSRTGVFMGMCSADYARLHLTSGDVTDIDAYSGTGVAFSVAVGRISYVLGFQGPNLAVDTSCSSSLVAVHLACQSLRSGESSLALAGGVNMMLSPETSIFLSRARALAPDGRCKTFDAAADGYTRGEGCGVVVLKRLSDAVVDGDRVLALIRGTAINHDGHTNGLTAPNGPSQEAVIREALAHAGVDPNDIAYVEAHGTGTALGDPIEVQSLTAVLAQERPADRPIVLGSIKTNIGHLEAAAGVAGLLKAVLAVQRGMIPPHLHFQRPGPYIAWSELPFVVPTALMPWPAGYGRRIAGVSAFGFSGTNAHVVLEEAPGFRPAASDDSSGDAELALLPISARDPAALYALASAYRSLLGPAGTAATMRDICYTAGARRSHHEYRLAVVGSSREELAEGIDAFLRHEPHPGLWTGRASSPLPAPVHGGGVEGRDSLVVTHALAEGYVCGQTPEWQSLFPSGGRCVSLPRYPWQRERFWVTDHRVMNGARTRASDRRPAGHNGHPLLGPHVEPATQPGTHIWETDLDADTVSYLRDHRVGGLIVVPAATFLDVALAAATQTHGAASLCLEAVTIGQVLTLPETGLQRVQVVVSAEFPGVGTVRVYSRDTSQESGSASTRGDWRLHAEGRIAEVAQEAGPSRHDAPAEIQARCSERVNRSTHYGALASRGLQYGPAFQRVEQVWRGSGEALGRVQPVPDADGTQVDARLLDACFQILGPALASTFAANREELFLPAGVERLRVVDRTAFGGPLWCHAVARRSESTDVLVGDLFLLDEQGHLVLEVLGLLVRRLVGSRSSAASSPPPNEGVPHPGPRPAGEGAVLPRSVLERQAGGEGSPDSERPTMRDVMLAAVPSARATLLESYLTALVARAVGRPTARIESSRPLSDLGLDSLMAMDLRNRIDADLGIVVPLTTFLQGPSVLDLVAVLAHDDVWEAALAVSTAAPATTAEPAGVPSFPAQHETENVDLPLSNGQRALWLTHQLAPRSTAYHIMFAARLVGDLDVLALESAVQMLMDRHSSLRTTYAIGRDGQPIQRVHARMAACFAAEDATGWSEMNLRQRLDADADQAFELERGPLLRVAVFRRADAEHVLLLTVHHLAVDFWSLEVLVDELRSLYDAAWSGQSATLPTSRQYVDFVRWQAEMLEGAAGERLRTYWQQKLSGELPVLALPTDRPRPRIQTYRGALFDFALDERLTARLKELARADGATLYATLLAAFSALLARYTGQRDLLIGSPMAGRGHADFERTVGYLVNVLPLRADLTGGPTFRELLRRTRDTVLEALDHQEYPFPLLVELLQPSRDRGRSPLVQVLFIWYRSALLEASVGMDSMSRPLDTAPALATPDRRGLVPDVLAWEQRGAPYDVMLLMTEAHESLLGRLQYNADLFDPDTIARLAEHFRRLLEGVAADPDRPVEVVRMLMAAERVQQLVSWNDTQAAYPAGACLHELFEAQVARTPDATALVLGAERLTYRELNRRANRVARRLRALGVGPDVLVGVCVERTSAMVAGLLAVLKAGGAYVPLDPAYPAARLSFMIRDSQVMVLLTQHSLAATPIGDGVEIVYLDDASFLDRIDEPASGDDENPSTGVAPANLAYVIYTSGSTGRPKGVAIEHHGPVALVAWARDTLSPDTLAGVLASTSICFDLSVFELFAPLSWGGAVILAENVLQLPRLPAAEQVTLINTVPSAMAELLRGYRLPASVRVVGLAGEALPNTLAQSLYRQDGVEQVLNLYGPTEDTVYSTWSLVERGTSEPPVIGRPIANKQAYVLDEHLQPVPVGVRGEVYLSGVGVARGYLNRPELTAERFIPNPFSDEPGSRLYRVGDYARYRPDGSIEWLGRVDQQVKIRGFRIEPGEIEAVLSRHPSVRESVVVARADRHGAGQLVAYLVRDGVDDGHPAPTISEVRRFLQRELPDYMLPASMVWLDALPRTPNGKLDRLALPDPGLDRPDLDAAYVEPRTAAEATLAEIWADVLEVERVGIHDSFFDLGGASFASVAIATRANEAGLPLTADLLFAYPTIAELTDLAAQMLADAAGAPLDTRPHSFSPVGARESLWHGESLAQAVRATDRGGEG